MAITANPDWQGGGLRAKCMLAGAVYCPNLMNGRIRSGDTTATFIYDPIKSYTESDSDGTQLYLQAAAGNRIAGVIQSFTPVTHESAIYRLASTERDFQFEVGMYVLFEIEVNTTLAKEDLKNTADIVVGSGNTISGMSGVELDISSLGTGAQLRIIDIVKQANNSLGTNTKALVAINEHEWSHDAAAV
jgi:hypothetical protein